MIRKHKNDIELTPSRVELNDLYDDVLGSDYAILHPYGYYGIISITPIVIYKLVKWAIRQGYILLDGTMRYKGMTYLERIGKDE